jgi:hypothetical protein
VGAQRLSITSLLRTARSDARTDFANVHCRLRHLVPRQESPRLHLPAAADPRARRRILRRSVRAHEKEAPGRWTTGAPVLHARSSKQGHCQLASDFRNAAAEAALASLCDALDRRR